MDKAFELFNMYFFVAELIIGVPIVFLMILFKLLTYLGGSDEEKKLALEEGRLGLAEKQYFSEKYRNYTRQQLQAVIDDESYSPGAVKAAKELLMITDDLGS